MVFFAACASWLQWRSHWVAALIPWAIAASGILGLWRPMVFRPVFVGWMTVSHPVGWLISQLVLLLIYTLVFTPFAFLFRLMGRDMLALRQRSDEDSYWLPKAQATDVQSYFRQS
jgi:hypothetical protein